MVRDPKVFLFDEPLSNLDAKLRVQVRSEIKALQRRLKTTTIYVTHDQVEAMTMGDKIVVLNGGKVEQIGAPLDLYDRPANAFVATFLGSPAMNLIAGTIENDETSHLKLNGGVSVPIAPTPKAWAGRSRHLRHPTRERRSRSRSRTPMHGLVSRAHGVRDSFDCALSGHRYCRCVARAGGRT